MNKASGKREITFKIRYTDQQGWASGYWNPAEMNMGGGVAFDCMEGWDEDQGLTGVTIYLFDDEVVSEMGS